MPRKILVKQIVKLAKHDPNKPPELQEVLEKLGVLHDHVSYMMNLKKQIEKESEEN